MTARKTMAVRKAEMVQSLARLLVDGGYGTKQGDKDAGTIVEALLPQIKRVGAAARGGPR